MNNYELSQIGNHLATELVKLSGQFNVKSDQYEILIWEADILVAKAKDLIENCGVNEYLKCSKLMGSNANNMAKHMPILIKKVKEFHDIYNLVRMQKTRKK